MAKTTATPRVRGLNAAERAALRRWILSCDPCPPATARHNNFQWRSFYRAWQTAGVSDWRWFMTQAQIECLDPLCDGAPCTVKCRKYQNRSAAGWRRKYPYARVVRLVRRLLAATAQA